MSNANMIFRLGKFMQLGHVNLQEIVGDHRLVKRRIDMTHPLQSESVRRLSGNLSVQGPTP